VLRTEKIVVRGIVQGVGFRPFVYRLAIRHALSGWVQNGETGVEIVVEGPPGAIDAFSVALLAERPPAAQIAAIERSAHSPVGASSFEIRASERRDRPTTRVSPDLPVCADCLRELFDPADRRCGYPYINCTNCGPRFSIVLSLPYDRPRTTMAAWPLCPDCAREYDDPLDRRFHAQPVACPRCGPDFVLTADAGPAGRGPAAIGAAAERLAAGQIVALKGIGGYHLACDARNAAAVRTLRERKYRKERPFALMARDLAVARSLVELTGPAEALLCAPAAPIVLAPARVELAGVAPETTELGVMLPYAPLHHLLFAAGAPDSLVMTSANRSSEPIAYQDDDARATLGGIADAFLAGERPIARRVDDSVVRDGPQGPIILRRGRGYSPMALGQGWPRSWRSVPTSRTRSRSWCKARRSSASTSGISSRPPRARRSSRSPATSAGCTRSSPPNSSWPTTATRTTPRPVMRSRFPAGSGRSSTTARTSRR
jgi:hydrogenase maturation protein HypF